MTDITFVLPRLDPTGGAKVIIQLAHYLTERGHKVAVTSPMYPYGGKFNLDHLRGAIKEWGYDVEPDRYLSVMQIDRESALVSTAYDTSYTVHNLVGSKGINFIQSYDQWHLYDDPGFWGWCGNVTELAPTYIPKDPEALKQKQYVDASYKFPMKKIVVSKWLQRVMSYLTPDECTLIPVGVDDIDPRFEYKPYAMEGNPLYISYIFRGVDYRGDKIVFGVRHEITRKFHDEVKFVEIYDISYSKLCAIYECSDIFLYGSKIEGFGLPPLEAMSHGCAICSTGVGAIPEYLPSKDIQMAGWPQLLTDRLEYLINNREIIPKLGEINRNEASKWDIFETVKQFEAYLDGTERRNTDTNTQPTRRLSESERIH